MTHSASARSAAPDDARSFAAPAKRGPILLAVHGGEATPAAVRAAAQLAALNRLELRVVTVIHFDHAFSGVPFVNALEDMHDAATGDGQVERVRQLLRTTLGEGTEWTLEVCAGEVVEELAGAARAMDATCIVVDAAPRRGLRHASAGNRARDIAAHAPCPVLSVRSSLRIPAAVIVVACDFSPASIRAAVAATLFANESTRFCLVHVPLPVHLPHAVRDRSGALYGGDPAFDLARVREEIESLAPAGMGIKTRILDGGIPSELLSFATIENADLLALGTRGPGPVMRFLLGSVAARVLSEASCPVLISPPAPVAEQRG